MPYVDMFIGSIVFMAYIVRHIFSLPRGQFVGLRRSNSLLYLYIRTYAAPYVTL